MMEAAIKGLTRADGTRPILIAVTQLTSTSEERMNEALANAMANGLYSPWYAEAKEMAGLPTAEEVSLPDETVEEAPEEAAAP